MNIITSAPNKQLEKNGHFTKKESERKREKR